MNTFSFSLKWNILIVKLRRRYSWLRLQVLGVLRLYRHRHELTAGILSVGASHFYPSRTPIIYTFDVYAPSVIRLAVLVLLVAKNRTFVGVLIGVVG